MAQAELTARAHSSAAVGDSALSSRMSLDLVSCWSVTVSSAPFASHLSTRATPSVKGARASLSLANVSGRGACRRALDLSRRRFNRLRRRRSSCLDGRLSVTVLRRGAASSWFDAAMAMPEHWLTQIAAFGTPDQAAGYVQSLVEAGADAVAFFPSPEDPLDDGAYAAEELLPLVRSQAS